nr:ABC transporter permease [Gluconacetobacter azotocaptans]
MRVIWALMMREIHTRFGRENIGFLWVIGEPILFCSGVAIMWTAIRPPHEHGLPITAIVITGYVPLTMWRHSIQRSVKAYEANGSLLFHRQVTPLDIIVARWALEVLGTLMAGLLVGSGAILGGYMKPPLHWGILYAGLGFHAMFCLATALIFAALTEMSETVEKIVGIATYLSLPFSGAFSMVAWLPQKDRWAMLCAPSVENMEMIREGQFGSTAHPIYDINYDFWATLTLLLIGIYLTLRVRRHIVVQ